MPAVHLPLSLSLRRRTPRLAKFVFDRMRALWDIFVPLSLWTPSLPSSPSARRAFMSYILYPFRIHPQDPANIRFSNLGIARGWVRVLSDRGLRVDMIDWENTRFRPTRRHYEMFIGHGGFNWTRLDHALPPDVPRLYFATTLEWREQNRRAEARLAALQARRGITLPPERRLSADEDAAYARADGIVCLGNEDARRTFPQPEKVIAINNAAYPMTLPFAPEAKDFSQARKHFLFFTSRGNVHKGLDLLLEAFEGADAHLYICQEIEPAFRAVYSRELETLPNIHHIGFIPMRGDRFWELAQRCAFIIHPSCAEGQPGSVVECLHAGLIPVLNRENNMTIDAFGVVLPDCEVSTLRAVIQACAAQSPDWLREKSIQTQAAARRDYSEDAFLHNLSAAVDVLLKRATADRVRSMDA